MLQLKLSQRETIEITTPTGKVVLHLWGDGYVGIDAPREWPVRRIKLPTTAPEGELPKPAHVAGRSSAASNGNVRGT